MQQLILKPPHRVPSTTLALLIGLAGIAGCLSDRAPESRPKEVVLPDLSTAHPSPVVDGREHPRPRARPAATAPTHGIVSAAWVEQRLGKPGLVLLDLRPGADYARGHLPGAISDPEGDSLWGDLGPRTSHKGPAPVRVPTRSQTVVLIHGGRTPAELSVATRAYLLLYDAGAHPCRLAVLRGGHEAWRRARLPLETGRGVPRAAAGSTSKPTPPVAPRPRPRKPPVKRGVILPDGAALAALRKDAQTLLVDARPRLRARPCPARVPPRKRPPWRRFDVAARLAPALGLTSPWIPALARPLGALNRDTAGRRVVLFSAHGRWASLLWFTWKTRLQRSDATLAVYFGIPPKH